MIDATSRVNSNQSKRLNHQTKKKRTRIVRAKETDRELDTCTLFGKLTNVGDECEESAHWSTSRFFEFAAKRIVDVVVVCARSRIVCRRHYHREQFCRRYDVQCVHEKILSEQM